MFHYFIYIQELINDKIIVYDLSYRRTVNNVCRYYSLQEVELNHPPSQEWIRLSDLVPKTRQRRERDKQ